MITLIRNISIIFCSYYLYHKLLNVKKVRNIVSALFLLFFSLLSTVLSLMLPSYLQYIIAPTIFILLFAYFAISTNTKTETIFTTLLLAYGICYIFFYLAGIVLITFLISFLYLPFKIKIKNYFLLLIIVTIFQIIFCSIPFRFKRFQKGMPFLYNQSFSNMGVFIGTLILFCSMANSTLSTKTSHHIRMTALLLVPFIFTLAIFIFMWWRNQIQQSYLLQLKERDNKRLEEQLELYKEKLSTLEQENQEMSSLIHRDNKLIPSMQLAVQRFMEISMLETDTEKIMKKGSSLLAQLEQEMLDRNGVVMKLSQPEQKLPSSGTDSIDQLLNYMQQRCIKENITLEVSFSDHTAEMVQDVIKEKDCLTILADLLENALIAVKAVEGKHILLQLGKIDSIYQIRIWDDGIPFHKSVLYYLGKKRYTTHQEEGGSGIGLMNTYALLQTYHATLQINEQTDDHPFYQKAIAILFDGKQEYRLIPNRPEKEIIYLKQRKELIIEETKRHN